MGTFKSLKIKTTEEQRKRNVRNMTSDIMKRVSENLGKEIFDAWPVPIIPVSFDKSVWKKIEVYHNDCWVYFFGEVNRRKDERMFVYHLGLANFAGHVSEVKEEYMSHFRQWMVFLQFGKNYPELFGGVNAILSYNQHVICGEQDLITEIKDLIPKLSEMETPLPGIRMTTMEWDTLRNQYIDGCVRLLADLTNPNLYHNGVVFSDIPEVFDERRNRNKTLGDFFDDYLSK